MMHRILFLLLVVSSVCVSGQAVFADEAPLRVLIDVRSDHSDGEHDFATLAAFAKKRAIDVLAFTEHDRFSIRFGLEPIPNIIGFQMQHPSLYVTGVDKFFDDLAAFRSSHPDMMFMAGTESTPGYHWTGIPFRDLTLHNPERHIIALGPERSEQVRALPSFDLRNGHGPFVLSMIFWCALVAIVLFILLRRRKRAVALLLFASFIAFLSTWLTRDMVDGDAAFIHAAHDQGLFTVWSHPGTKSGTRPGPMGVILDTPPYSARVFREPTADGFAAFYGDTDSNAVPGGLWDGYMVDFMAGSHTKPIWAVSAGDYHGEGQSGEYLGNYPMDVWADKRTPAAVLKALHKGHMVAWRAQKSMNFRVVTLSLQDASGQTLLPGDMANVSADVAVHFMLRELPDSGRVARANKAIRVRLIVDGEVRKTMLTKLGLPLQAALHLSQGAHVVRLDLPHQWLGSMIANPFLLHVSN